VAETPNQTLRVELDGDTLRADAGSPFVLRPIGQYRFEVVGPGVVVSFDVADDGERVTLDAPGLGRFFRADAWEPAEAELALFEGTYHSAELGTDYRLALDDGALWFHHRKLESRRLTPTFPDAFSVRGSSAIFTRDADGRIDGFALSDGRVWNVRFDKAGG